MTDREAMRKLVEQAYAERASGNLEGVMAAFHPDAVFELVGDNKILPLAGEVRGHPNVREAMVGFIDAFKFLKRDIIAFIAEGDRAAVHSRLEIRFAKTNVTFKTDVTDLFKFRDGKIIELVEFADTALIKDITSGA